MKTGRLWLAAGCLFLGSLIATGTPARSAPTYTSGEVIVKTSQPMSSLGTGKTSGGSPLTKALRQLGISGIKPLDVRSGPGARGKMAARGGIEESWCLLRFHSSADVRAIVESLSLTPGILHAEPNYIGSLCAVPDDPLYAPNQQTVYGDVLGLETAWNVTTGSKSVVVAILDSGIDPHHPEFADGRLLTGYNFVTDSADTSDPIGHGTRVAGIIGARGNNADGMSGVCWDVSLLPVVVAGADSLVTAATVAQAIQWAVAQGADVINMSLAMGSKSLLLQATCAGASDHAILVAAAGNQGQNLVPLYPAAFDSVIGVSAVDDSLSRAPFSNYNYPGINEFITLAAPGTTLFTTMPPGLYDGRRSNGTSFAAPIVSGVAALLMDRYPGESPGALRAHLERTASAAVAGDISIHGLIDAGNALSTPLVPILCLAEVEIRDGTDIDPGNDADSALDGGETAEIVLTIENKGADLDAFTGTLVSFDANITIVTSTVSFPPVPFGVELRHAVPFTVMVSAVAPQSLPNLRLQILGVPDLEFRTVIEDEQALPLTIASNLVLGNTKTWMIAGLTTVATGATLTVEPGTTVKLGEDARLEVFGGLSSLGTQENPIQWLNHQPPPESLFAPSFELPVGDSPESVALGDVTGDGIPDIVTANSANDDVSVLAGDEAGGFAPQVRFSVGDYPRSVALGDVTGDGVPDIVTANWDSDDVSVLVGDGAGGFNTDERFSVGDSPGSVALGDVTGDGMPDIVTTNYYRSDVVMLAGNGTGSFAAQVRFPVGFAPKSVALGDVTGDGAMDIVTVNGWSDDVSVLVGDGAGGFATEVRYAVGPSPVSVALGDVTGDGVLDIVTANAGDDVSVLAGDGAGGFASEARFAVGDWPQSVALGDVTGDGVLDIVTTNFYSNDVSVLAADGTGGFAPQARFAVRPSPGSVALGDVTGDGVLDIVTALHHEVSILVGNPARRFDIEERFSVGDDPIEVALGDVTGDGLPDIVTANRASGDVTVLAGDGTGGLAPEERFSVDDYPVGVALGDVTSDGTLDIVTANTSTWCVNILASDGAGGFLPPADFYLERPPLSVALGDVTGDGVPDIVTTANRMAGDVSVLAGDGTGGFAAPAHFPVGDYPDHVALEDVTGDGLLDIVTKNTDRGALQDVSVLLANGAGGFAPEVRLLPGDIIGEFVVQEYPGWHLRNADASIVIPLSRRLACADVTGDSAPDFVTLDDFIDGVLVQAGNGLGGFVSIGAYLMHLDIDTYYLDVALGDVTGDGASDIVIAIGNHDDVSVLAGDGAGGFGLAASLLGKPGSQTQFLMSEFSLPGPVTLEGTGDVQHSLFRSTGGTGLVIGGNTLVRDSTSENCITGFAFSQGTPPPAGLVAIDNRGIGLLVRDASDCRAIGNNQHGILASGSLENCLADLNGGVGLYAQGNIRDSIATRSTANGIQAATVTNSLAASNFLTGIVASQLISGCTAINNGVGMQAPRIENCLVIGSYGAALAGATDVIGSEIFENVSISTDEIQYNDTIIANNEDEATIDSINGMYIAGNAGGGVKGIPATNCTIIGNRGPGVDANTTVTDSNVVFNDGAGIVGGTFSNVYLNGNRGGNLAGGAAGTPASSPVLTAPPFLRQVSPGESQPIGVGGQYFRLTFSEPMQPTRLIVSFGQSLPYSQHLLDASPGWTNNVTWQGWYAIGDEVGSGTHTLRVAGAVSVADNFHIPPDLYHDFFVDTKDGDLSISNGRATALSGTEVELTWDPAPRSDITHYTILRKTTTSEYWNRTTHLLDEIPAPATGMVDDTCAAGATYFYMVYEYDSTRNYDQLTTQIECTTLGGSTPTPGPTPSPTPTVPGLKTGIEGSIWQQYE